MIECDYIVCNSDPPNVYKNLIKSNNYNFFFKQKMKRMDYSMGLLFTILDQKSSIKMLLIILFSSGTPTKKHLEKILKKILSEDIGATICIDLQLQIQIWHLMDRTHFMYWFLCPKPFKYKDWSNEGEKFERFNFR